MKITVDMDIDFELLRQQKQELIDATYTNEGLNKMLEGVLNILDAIQDSAVDENGIDAKLVFGEDNDED
jgi:hypothetical protein